MVGFLLAFFLIYSGMHAVVAFRILTLVPQNLPVRLFFFAFLILMIICPIVTHQLDRAGHHSLAIIPAWTGYTWMGFIFVAFCLALAFIILELLATGLRSFLQGWSPLLSAEIKAVLLIGMALSIMVVGAFEARSLAVEHVRLTSPKLKNSFTLVQISDVHLGLLAGEKRVRAIRDELERIKPDILVCTGDLIDSNPESLAPVSRELKSFQAPGGKFAVTGNHEVYAGLERSRLFLQDSGFTVLDDQVWNGQGITLAGTSFRHEPACSQEERLWSRIKPENVVILLKHSPTVCSDSTKHFDLQLSGHTHKGQIFPFGLAVKAFFSYLAGTYPLLNDATLHVNRGTGTWGPQVRFLAPPELTVVTIQGEKQT